METALRLFREEYLDMLLRFLWREWSSLGVAGQEQTPVRHVIDPEALLLFTCSLARYDQRLFDEVLDWLTVNGRFLNVQRMRNMLRKESFHGGPVVGSVADWLSRREEPMKWGLLAKANPPAREVEHLFFLKDGRPLPDSREKDAVFLAHGLSRNPVRPRGYSRPFPAGAIPCHLLKMRALFGANARCDVLAYLTMNHGGHPSEIAREMSYSQKAIHDVMADLACSGVIHSAMVGRKRVFRFSSSGLPLLGGDSDIPGWINWSILLSSAEAVWEKVDELNTAALDPLLESSEILLSLKPLLQHLIKAPWAPTLPSLQDQAAMPLLHAFRAAFESLAL